MTQDHNGLAADEVRVQTNVEVNFRGQNLRGDRYSDRDGHSFTIIRDAKGEEVGYTMNDFTLDATEATRLAQQLKRAGTPAAPNVGGSDQGMDYDFSPNIAGRSNPIKDAIETHNRRPQGGRQ